MRNLAKLLPIFAFFGGMAVLRADTPPDQPTDAKPADTTAKSTAPPPLSNAEISKHAAEIKTQIEADRHRILFLKEQTKKLKDVIKLSCVNDKLVQVNAEMNIADATNDQLQNALAKNGDDRQTLYTALTTTAGEIKRLREEAAACVGDGELYKQEARTSVQHPDIVDDPNAIDPFGVELEPPGYATPWH